MLNYAEVVAKSREELKPRLIEFYEPHVAQPVDLIDKCFNYANDNTPARLLLTLHRLIELADQSQDEQLRLFFLIICTEALFKLVTGRRGNSKKSVLRYFDSYTSLKDRSLIESSFKRSLGDEKVAPRDSVELDLREIILIFYDVRCQTVHEGITYDFHFSDDGKTWMMNWVDVSKPHEAPDIRVFKTNLQYGQFKAVVIRAGVQCIEGYLSASAGS